MEMLPEELTESCDVDQIEPQNKHFTQLCASLILQTDLPLSYFQKGSVRKMMKVLNPNAFIPPRAATDAFILKMYKEEKAKLKQEMATIPNGISLTFDLWIAATTECFLCLTAHFVDTNWKLNRKILNFSRMLESDLPERIPELLNEWKIEKKVTSLTFDNSFVDSIMKEEWKSKLALQNSLLCDEEIFHVHCFGRILSQMAKEGLEVAGDVLQKIRESVNYVKDSKSKMKKFKECTERVGGVDISAGLRSEMLPRWHSTYLMLDSALKYQRVFASLHSYDDNYKTCPSAEEWKRAEKVCAFLLPFYQTTDLISGTSYPTSNLCFLQVWKIHCALLDGLRDEDEVIKSMAERMMGKFGKYWDQYSVLLALGVVLDPRMKFSTLAYCYSKIDASTSERKLQQVKETLYLLFEKYSCKSASVGVQTQSAVQTQFSSMPKPEKFKPLSHNLFGELTMHYQQLASETVKSQLDVYLDEPNLEFCYYGDLDVLQWWQSNNTRFSQLSILARGLLSTPITTVLSEYQFNFGSCFLDKSRDDYVPECVEVLICTRNWLFGFDSIDDSDDDVEEADSEPESNDSYMKDDDDAIEDAGSAADDDA